MVTRNPAKSAPFLGFEGRFLSKTPNATISLGQRGEKKRRGGGQRKTEKKERKQRTKKSAEIFLENLSHS